MCEGGSDDDDEGGDFVPHSADLFANVPHLLWVNTKTINLILLYTKYSIPFNISFFKHFLFLPFFHSSFPLRTSSLLLFPLTSILPASVTHIGATMILSKPKLNQQLN